MPSWSTRRMLSMLRRSPHYHDFTSNLIIEGYTLDLAHLPSRLYIELPREALKTTPILTAYIVSRRIILKQHGWTVLTFTPYQLAHQGRLCAEQVEQTITTLLEDQPLPLA